SVGPDELQDGAVEFEHIANLAVGTAKIANAAITNAKIVSVEASKITAGTITASISMTSPTITGGTIRTSSGSSRVEMEGSTNSLKVYVSGSERGRFGLPSSGPVLNIDSNSYAA